MTVYEKLLNVQAKLKAPKSQFNSFGKYSYRSCEDILESVKPHLLDNKLTLQLSDEIVESVKNGLFHIYSISTIEEGIEVLTGVPAGKKDKNGNFPAGTVNYLVHEKLKKYAEISEK